MQKKKNLIKQNLDQAGCKYTGKKVFFMLHLRSAKLRKSYLQVTKNPIMSLEE